MHRGVARAAAGALASGLVLAAVVSCTSPAATLPPTRTAGTNPPAATAPATSYKDVSVEVAGRKIQLTNGLSEIEAAPGSAAKIVTRYFGNDATGDLNADGTADTAFLITQTTGGSGTFYYAVVALRARDGYQGTNAVLLGDRIAPQTTEIRGGELIVNYADRRPGEPMTTAPSVGLSKYLKVVGGSLQVAR